MMDDSMNTEQVRARAWGLCASCTHAVVITSDRGSEFVQCALSKTDPRFPRYPRLPVLACAGYRPRGA
jgi:hypothetical protein